MAVAMYNDLDHCPDEEIFSPESWEKAAVASEATEALWFSTSAPLSEPAAEGCEERLVSAAIDTGISKVVATGV